MIIYLISLSQKIKDFKSSTQIKHLSKLFLRKILSKELDIPEQNIKLSRHSFGKPYLTDGKRHFNASFSNGVFMMVTDDTPVGADIEYIKELDDIDDLIRYFANEEQQIFCNLNDPEKTEYFYRLWVLKESYVKAIGKGLGCPLDSFCIVDKPTNCALIHSVEHDMDWKLKYYSFPKEYKAAVCARNDAFPKKLNMFQINDFLNL